MSVVDGLVALAQHVEIVSTAASLAEHAEIVDPAVRLAEDSGEHSNGQGASAGGPEHSLAIGNTGGATEGLAEDVRAHSDGQCASAGGPEHSLTIGSTSIATERLAADSDVIAGGVKSKDAEQDASLQRAEILAKVEAMDAWGSRKLRDLRVAKPCIVSARQAWITPKSQAAVAAVAPLASPKRELVEVDGLPRDLLPGAATPCSRPASRNSTAAAMESPRGKVAGRQRGGAIASKARVLVQVEALKAARCRKAEQKKQEEDGGGMDSLQISSASPSGGGIDASTRFLQSASRCLSRESRRPATVPTWHRTCRPKARTVSTSRAPLPMNLEEAEVLLMNTELLLSTTNRGLMGGAYFFEQ
eukprot:TRINITY_DN60121_c0_g1_i1.p2 TRINITY_DN60121_c0_g1~~TRINITY_DN60121_c0_g1_i1.p2  ORF type:complete len:360 (-),score=71.05 TRINITY_DN60121_c0_g1_i1:14-1093(-)